MYSYNVDLDMGHVSSTTPLSSPEAVHFLGHETQPPI